MSKNIAVIFAGGVGKRMGNGQIPKQFLIVEEKPIMIHTLEYFENHEEIDAIYIACVSDWIKHLENLITEFRITKVAKIVEGGETAQDSIYNGLKAAREDNTGDSVALIHDGVRPFITGRLISDCIKSVKERGNAVTCTPCFETIIISEDDSKVGDVPLRKDTHSAQAPQAFRLDDIITAHEETRAENPTYENVVDACTMLRLLGKDVYMVPGNIGNIKITKPEDVYILEGLLKYRKSEEIMGLSLLDAQG